MRFRVPLAIVAAAIILGASGAAADPTGRYIYVAPAAGWTVFDGNINAPDQPLEDAGYWGARAGWQWKPTLAFEAAGGFTSTQEYTANFPGAEKWSYWHLSGNVVWTPWRGLIGNPFLSLGFGPGSLTPANSSVTLAGFVDSSGAVSQGNLEGAIGWTGWVTDKWGIRVEGRGVAWLPNKLTKVATHTMIASAAFTYTIGSKPRDTDADKIPDRRDHEIHSAAGATVDSMGVHLDSDGDGVFDGPDQCPDTRKECPVDAKGCPLDSDGDGVCDGMDKCPGTTPGMKVDTTGCPPGELDMRQDMIDTGRLKPKGIEFETGTATLKPAAPATLDVVGDMLSQWDSLRVEIGAHADAKGKADRNFKLSQARADTIRTYLLGRFPKLHGDQYTAKGFKETNPVPRVEFKVLNTDVLLRQATPAPAPADTSKTKGK